jgi:hypothetical protein
LLNEKIRSHGSEIKAGEGMEHKPRWSEITFPSQIRLSGGARIRRKKGGENRSLHWTLAV